MEIGYYSFSKESQHGRCRADQTRLRNSLPQFVAPTRQSTDRRGDASRLTVAPWRARKLLEHAWDGAGGRNRSCVDRCTQCRRQRTCGSPASHQVARAGRDHCALKSSRCARLQGCPDIECRAKHSSSLNATGTVTSFCREASRVGGCSRRCSETSIGGFGAGFLHLDDFAAALASLTQELKCSPDRIGFGGIPTDTILDDRVGVVGSSHHNRESNCAELASYVGRQGAVVAVGYGGNGLRLAPLTVVFRTRAPAFSSVL